MPDSPTVSDPLISVLLNCLHRDPRRFPVNHLSEMDRQQWDHLADLAKEHRVVPQLYQKLMTAGNEIQTDNSRFSLEHMSAYSRQVSKNNLRFYGELHKVLSSLEENEIPVILLKGIYLAEHVYENRGLREMNDMDLLFKREHLTPAYLLLKQMGFEPLRPVNIERIDYMANENHHLPRMIKPETAGIEVHWNIVNPGQSFSIDPAELWQRARQIDSAYSPVCTLPPADLMLHLCLHTSYQHNFSFGMRPFCDLTAVIDRFDEELEWDVVCSRSEAYGWSRGVLLSLVIAKDFLGADVPDNVIKRLQTDDFGPAVVDTARRQILTKKEDSNEAGDAVLTFASAGGLVRKASAVFSRLFIPKEQMFAKYPVRPGSPMIYLWYLFRIGEMIWRHTFKILRVLRGDPEYTGIIERKRELLSWLEKKQ